MVHEIRKDALNAIVVELAATKGDKLAAGARARERLAQMAHGAGVVSCRFGDEAAAAIGELEREMLVEVEGTGLGMVLGTPQLGECRLSWSQPADLEAFAVQAAASYELCFFGRLTEEQRAMLREVATNRTLPDGGVAPRALVDLAKNAVRVGEENRAALTKLGREPLPCSAAAVQVLGGCDGASESGPECFSPLINAAWKHVHHD